MRRRRCMPPPPWTLAPLSPRCSKRSVRMPPPRRSSAPSLQPFLARDLGALFAGFRQPDRDRLLLALDGFATAATFERAALAFTHRALHIFLRFLGVLACHTLLPNCRRYPIATIIADHPNNHLEWNKVPASCMSTPRQRIDRLLVEHGLFDSRAKAQAAIEAGLVTANGAPVRKASEEIPRDASLRAGAAHPYVSRGGVKLAMALDHFGFDPRGRVCLDVGASTGGFTQVLLDRGARLVYAVDVGRGQIGRAHG